MIFVRVPIINYDCWICEPVQWRWGQRTQHTESGSINKYDVSVVGYLADKDTVVIVGGRPQWVPIRTFLSPDDASQCIVEIQEGRWPVAEVMDWMPGQYGLKSIGERVETVADLHVSRVVRGAGRSRYRRKKK